ncbi:MAG: SAM-dependent methyltransferase [Pseudomonadota bacterium]
MSLKDRIIALIGTDGPLPVSVYMTLCLHDPEHGYYARGGGLGRDFATAPETSQAFGELIGLWCAHEWLAMGSPDPCRLIELGPGRGTLLADALRATARHGGFREALDVQLVEASPALRAEQAERLAGDSAAAHKVAVSHPRDLSAVPDGPALLIANEFLDCLPARQFVRDGGTWRERVIGISDEGRLVAGLAADQAPDMPASPENVLELQPGLETLVETLGRRRGPFRALFADYGPADRAPGDTLRAYRAGEQVDPLADPGEADLTVDVDFARLKRLAETAGLAVHGPVLQGGFLMALGLQARLDQLVAANPDEAADIFAAAQRLVDPAEMGTRFQVICLSTQGLPPPAGF